MRIPRHLAIIMDGNGRWAEKRACRASSATSGVSRRFRRSSTNAAKLGISYLTLYAFSSENWGRPVEEVNALMGLLGRYLRNELATMLKQGIRLKVIGEIGRLPGEIRQSSRRDRRQYRRQRGDGPDPGPFLRQPQRAVRAARSLAQEVRAGRLAPETIDEAALAGRLDTADLPDPDLLIRTSGEMPHQQFFALATRLCRTLFHRCPLARLRPRRTAPGH